MRRAFTLIELVCTIAILAILAALLLPVLERGLSRARRTACVNQLRNIGLAFQSFAHDHSDAFPMQVSTNQGGTKEIADATLDNPDLAFTCRHFQALSNDLVLAKVLRCPVDTRRVAANDFGEVENTNVSYWVNVAATFSQPMTPLSGDRNVRTSGRTEWTFINFGAADRVEFNSELHGYQGNVLFGGGQVETLAANRLQRAFAGTNLADATLSLPRPVHVSPLPANAVRLEQISLFGGGNTPGLVAVPPGDAKREGPNTTPAAPARTPATPGKSPDPDGPTANQAENRPGAGDAVDGMMTIVMLDGTRMITNWPEGKSMLMDTPKNRESVARGDPFIEVLRDLTRKAAQHTYLLLFWLLLALIALEMSRRWAERRRRRRKFRRATIRS